MHVDSDHARLWHGLSIYIHLLRHVITLRVSDVVFIELFICCQYLYSDMVKLSTHCLFSKSLTIIMLMIFQKGRALQQQLVVMKCTSGKHDPI